MAKPLLGIAAKALDRAGYRLAPKELCSPAMPDVEEEFYELHELCSDYSAAAQRLYAAYQAAQHVAQTRIAGDIVECGVWRGGSMMLVALT